MSTELPAGVVNPDDSAMTDLNPNHLLVGVLATREDAETLFAELDRAGIGSSDVRVFTGPDGARSIDHSGTEHGLVATVKRLVQMTHVDFDFKHYYADEAEAGRFVVAIHCDDDTARMASQGLMTAHNARNLFYFGAASFEEIMPAST